MLLERNADSIIKKTPWNTRREKNVEGSGSRAILFGLRNKKNSKMTPFGEQDVRHGKEPIGDLRLTFTHGDRN